MGLLSNFGFIFNLRLYASVFSVQMACEEGKAKSGLEAGLRELARCRLHGFTEQELKIAAAKQLAEAEQLFVEKDQTYCTSLRDELVGHFLRGELVVGRGLHSSTFQLNLSRFCLKIKP